LILFFLPLELWASPGVRTVLVFPFENLSTRADLDWISESFAEILSSRLGSSETYVLGREERNGAYQQLDVPPYTPLTLASEYKVAETLGVDWAIVGNFQVEGDRLTARAQLLDVHKRKLSPPLEATGALADLVDLQTRLAWRLLATHDPAFTAGTEEDFRKRFPEVRLDAFENYIRGVLAADDETRLRFWAEAARLNPDDHRAAFALGRFAFEQKQYAQSAQWLRKLDPSDANYLEAQFLLGVDEFFLGHPPAAQKAFETLARELPLNEVSNNLGVLEVRRGQYPAALASFQRAFQGDPTDPDFSFNLGVALWYLQRYPEAVKALEEAVRANAEDMEAHTLLAAVSEKLGDKARESRELGWLSEHDVGPGIYQLADVLPRARLKKNYDGRAFRLLSVAFHNALEGTLAKAPREEHGQVHLARGQSLLAEGRLPEAERELNEALSLIPNESEIHLALARLLEAQGRPREAAEELETSLKLKDSVQAHLALARVYLSLGRPEAARTESRAALSLDPNNADAENLMEQIQAQHASAGKGP